MTAPASVPRDTDDELDRATRYFFGAAVGSGMVQDVSPTSWRVLDGVIKELGLDPEKLAPADWVRLGLGLYACQRAAA